MISMIYIQGTEPHSRLQRLGGLFGAPSVTQSLLPFFHRKSVDGLAKALDEKQATPGFDINTPLRHLHTEAEYDQLNDPVRVWRTPLELAVDDWKLGTTDLAAHLIERGARITGPTMAIALKRILENSNEKEKGGLEARGQALLKVLQDGGADWNAFLQGTDDLAQHSRENLQRLAHMNPERDVSVLKSFGLDMDALNLKPEDVVLNALRELRMKRDAAEPQRPSKSAPGL